MENSLSYPYRDNKFLPATDTLQSGDSVLVSAPGNMFAAYSPLGLSREG